MIYRFGPVPVRGAFRDRHKRGMGCGGRRCAFDERCGSGRRRRVVLTPRRWCQVLEKQASQGRRWQESPFTGERVISRKAIAQGRPRCSRWTCMLMRALLVHIAHETAGAARTRSSLRPLYRKGEYFLQRPGRNAPRDREATVAATQRKTISRYGRPLRRYGIR